jgi:hypothetical protein
VTRDDTNALVHYTSPVLLLVIALCGFSNRVIDLTAKIAHDNDNDNDNEEQQPTPSEEQ